MKLPREVIATAHRTGARTADGSEHWSTNFIFPVGWTSKDHRKVAVVEPDSGWPPARNYWVGDGEGFITFLIFLFLAIANWAFLWGEVQEELPGIPPPSEPTFQQTLGAPPEAPPLGQ